MDEIGGNDQDEPVLSALADAFTVVGNLAVLLTLTLLLKQTRDARRATQQFTAHSMVESMNSLYQLLASTEGLASIYRKGRADPDSLTADEEARFFYACVSYFSAQENLYRACQTDVMPKDYFDSWDKAIREDLRDAGFVRYWRQEESYYDRDFRDYVNRTIRRQPRQQPSP